MTVVKLLYMYLSNYYVMKQDCHDNKINVAEGLLANFHMDVNKIIFQNNFLRS